MEIQAFNSIMHYYYSMVSRVAVVKCDSYDELVVESSVTEALSLIGGIKKFVKPKDKVLLKVNLLMGSSPDKSVTTHPSVVKAMVLQVQSAGGTAIIGDSPGGPFNRKSLEGAYEKSGYIKVAQETGAILNYNTCAKQVSYPKGRLLKKLDIIDLVGEVDVVITMPKMKTHMLTKFTGATKILFGVVPGLTKPAYHLKFSDIDLFCDMLLDILGYVKPAFSLMDGVIGIEGDGPGASGTPKKAGLILASEDSVALDVTATNIIGMEPNAVPILRRAIHHGLTSGKLCYIEVAGEKIDDVKITFKQPSGGTGIFEKIVTSKLLRKLFLSIAVPYPVANKNCVRCGVCKQSCPAGAITITDRAHMDLKKCLRCYCCHELCQYKAVALKSRLGWMKRKKKN
jgi:uncharacterized protein (DUF362 family)/Pyruvate/2-oxoacid:ferredoxin oxidoreductase delta subunit